jgi:L-amino acid N-acyltransferase YncA
MDYTISPMSADDRQAVMDIFNYYVEHSFAAYPEKRLPDEAFDLFLQIAKDYPTGVARDQNDEIVGFGFLHPFRPLAEFVRTAEVSYSIRSDHAGRGLGKKLLEHFENEGRARGIKTFSANISSLNPVSIEFHRKNGFVECGRFKSVGVKNGREFDMVWMQKFLA